MAKDRLGTLKKTDVHIALLRGINLSTHNRLPMTGLVSIFEQAGCQQVRTYIQSGNVIFEAQPELARKIPNVISKAITRQFGLEIPLVTRTAAELRTIVRANPFQRSGADERVLHVAFLADSPDADRVAGLDPDRSPPDEYVVRGREIYLRCPNGVARTKLTNAYFDSRLATISTIRNWKTTLKLLELAAG